MKTRIFGILFFGCLSWTMQATTTPVAVTDAQQLHHHSASSHLVHPAVTEAHPALPNEAPPPPPPTCASCGAKSSSNGSITHRSGCEYAPKK